MAERISDEERDELTPENFDTTVLLRAVDAVDVLRDDLPAARRWLCAGP